MNNSKISATGEVADETKNNGDTLDSSNAANQL